jgi:hypothetical protein
MSEYAKAVLELPVSPERAKAEREAQQLFKKNKEKLKAAILRDERLPSNYRLIGWEIVELLNFKTGYAWPSQEFLAEKSHCGLRTVRRAVARLSDEHTGWFRRELDGRNNCYFPRFERLDRPRDRGHSGPPIEATSGVSSGLLSSLVDPPEKEILINRVASDQIAERPPANSKRDGSNADRLKDGVVSFANQDEIITELAQRDGKRHFVFQDSAPWELWTRYLAAQGRPPMMPRRHLLKGKWRVGCDMPSFCPPGSDYQGSPDRYRGPRGAVADVNDRQLAEIRARNPEKIEASPFLLERLRRMDGDR